jgi:hypothetical protein
MIFGLFTLAVALIISAVAAYYSIVGLTTIFSAAVIPIIIMGAALEVGKVTAAVWLKLNWARARWTYKLYLVPAVAFLMLLTSMGIFGFLSKAHSDQSLVSGDVQSKIAIYDEKIKTAKENIEADRRQLRQMDEAVDQVMARSTTEEGATKSNAIRRAQARDRAALAKNIEANQKLIGVLNDEAAPIRAEVRKVEAEVGPIKYIAALIYGNTADNNLLEAAVRWVIILIVAVFDPLALVLILAAQQSIRWAQEEKESSQPDPWVADVGEKPTDDEKMTDEEFRRELENDPELSAFFDRSREVARALDRGDSIPAPVEIVEPERELTMLERYPYLSKPFEHFKNLKPMVYRPEVDEPVEEKKVKIPKKKKPDPKEEVKESELIAPTVPVEEKVNALPVYQDLHNGYINVEGKNISMEALKGIYPEIWAEVQRKQIEDSLKPQADNSDPAATSSHATFGTEFPLKPSRGEMFLNINTLPSRLFKFNGQRWIEVDKALTDSYTYNEEYLQYLVDKIDQAHLSLDDLTNSEQEQISEYLKKNVK